MVAGLLSSARTFYRVLEVLGWFFAEVPRERARRGYDTTCVAALGEETTPVISPHFGAP